MSLLVSLFQEVTRDWVLLEVVLVPRTGKSAIWDVGVREVFTVYSSVSVL